MDGLVAIYRFISMVKAEKVPHGCLPVALLAVEG